MKEHLIPFLTLRTKCIKSLGQRMEDPKLLILDEPLNGLDEQGVEDIRALLLELRGKVISRIGCSFKCPIKIFF